MTSTKSRYSFCHLFGCFFTTKQGAMDTSLVFPYDGVASKHQMTVPFGFP